MEKIAIGDIVTLKSHPFAGDNINIIISGEHLMLAPMMVVVEILNVTQSEHSEVDGSLIIPKGSSSCKCIWYSSKSNQFEESWHHSTQINIVNNNHNPIDDPKSLLGKNISLKTLDIELGKRKSSLNTEVDSSNRSKDKSSLSALLSFVPPVMQVIDIKENDAKENKFDIKTGNQKRFTPKYNVKCKWYNPSGDKYSEKYLPIESIFLLPNVETTKIDELQKLISNSSILKLNDGLIKPLTISYRSGYVIMTAFDFVRNKNQELTITNDTDFKEEEQLYISEAPNFKLITSIPGSEWKLVDTISDLMKIAVEKKYYLRIQYKNLNGENSMRTLKDLKIHVTLEDNGTGPEEVEYLEGYCHFRKAIRYFKVDRIIKIQVLNLVYS